MTTFFVSRHPGAREWAEHNGITADQHCTHLDMAQVQPGDIVIGTLPVHLAAAVCARGARYAHLVLNLPQPMRGRELSASELQSLGTHVRYFSVTPTAHPTEPQP